jgi:hypothetical protein
MSAQLITAGDALLPGVALQYESMRANYQEGIEGL